MARTFAQTQAGYTNMWNGAALMASKKSQAVIAAARIMSGPYKAAFQVVEAATGVPWWFIGGLLYRESDINLNTYLGNGDPLTKKTVDVPVGRGPFIGSDGKGDFVAGAIDALKYQGFTKYTPDQWTIPFALYQAEEFNGEGYTNKGVNSPYVWAGTNWEQPGLFVSDGKFSTTQTDPRVGVAAIWAVMAQTDQSILVPSSAAPGVNPVQQPVTQAPSAPQPKVTSMVTTAAATKTAVANTFEQDIDALENGLNSVVGFLPILTTFVPQLSVVVPFIPVIQGIINLVKELQTTGNDPVNIANLLATHLQAAATNTKASV